MGTTASEQALVDKIGKNMFVLEEDFLRFQPDSAAQAKFVQARLKQLIELREHFGDYAMKLAAERLPKRQKVTTDGGSASLGIAAVFAGLAVLLVANTK